MRVFIVEDLKLTRDNLVEQFKKQGWTIAGVVSDTSEKSFQMAITSKTDLFILDIGLEHDKAGFEFAKRLHQNNETVKFVYLTNKKEFFKEAFSRNEYPTPYDFIPKTDFISKGMDECIENLVIRFSSHQSPRIRLVGQNVSIDDIMLVEIKSKSLLNVYLKDGRILEKPANLKDLINPDKEDFISTLVAAHKNLLVNENTIVSSERKNKKEEPATLIFRATNGKEYRRETSNKRGADFHKRHK
jgi:DNA-binding LytR/AlgR family response regulator